MTSTILRGSRMDRKGHGMHWKILHSRVTQISGRIQSAPRTYLRGFSIANYFTLSSIADGISPRHFGGKVDSRLPVGITHGLQLMQCLSTLAADESTLPSQPHSQGHALGKIFTNEPSIKLSAPPATTDLPTSVANMKEVQYWASQSPTPLRLADMYRYASGADTQQRIRNAQFLHREIRIRVAQRAVDLLSLPYGLCESRPIQQVASIYLRYMQSLHEMPKPETPEQEVAFTDALHGFVLDRGSIPTMIARGIQEWKNTVTTENSIPITDREAAEQQLNDALYRFFTARVGLRFLTEHHVLSSGRSDAERLRSATHIVPKAPEENNMVPGLIQTHCRVAEEVRKVAELVRHQTADYLKCAGVAAPSTLHTRGQCCPDIVIVDCNKEQKAFTYVPHHLQYMVAELLKNSVRATIRHHYLHYPLDDRLPPPIKVVIAMGEEDVTIKVADRGGGIPRSKMQSIWKFAHSTADENELEVAFGMDETSGAKIRGFGLPLARIYARYFGGELTLKSTEGYGLDSYLYIPRLGEKCENLPTTVRDSPGERDSTPLQRVSD